MLKALRYFSVLVVFLGAIWILSTSSSLHDCIEKQTAAKGQQAKEHSPELVLAIADHAAICIRCIGHATYEYRDAATAVATVFIAIFTFTLWKSTKRMMEATQVAVDLARQEFISTHRPQLRLKHIWISSQDGQTFVGELQADEALTVRLDVVNIGESDAIISMLNFVTVILEPNRRLPQRPPYNEPNVPQYPVRPPFRLGSGITFTTHVSDGRVLSEADIDAIERGMMVLYCIGAFEYWGADQGRRQTAFCRRLEFAPEDSPRLGRFEKEQDPDYEYQD